MIVFMKQCFHVIRLHSVNLIKRVCQILVFSFTIPAIHLKQTKANQKHVRHWAIPPLLIRSRGACLSLTNPYLIKGSLRFQNNKRLGCL